MPEREKVELARQFLFILNRGYVGNLDSISASPDGAPDDGMAGDRETVGAVSEIEQSTAIQMVRITESGQPVWVISRETIEMVPQLFPEFGFPNIERMLPSTLISTHIFSMPLWVLIAILAAFPLSIAIGWALTFVILRLPPPSWHVERRPAFPAVLFIGLILHNLASRLLGLPLVYRVWYSRVLIVLWLVLAVWLTFMIIGYLDRRAKVYLLRNGLSSTQAMLQLGRRLLQIFVILAAILAGLRSFGFDISAALAGLGIGGIAVAFAAQKTLENVFGGLSLLSDQSIRVGDSCQFGPIVAKVEDIGLRATRFRTIQRSVLFIPNGQLASMNIENLGQRDRILFRHTIGVKYGLESRQLQALLGDLRSLLDNDVRFAPEPRRVRFLKFGDSALEIEFFAYILTSDFNEFLSIQEELLFRIMEVVTANKSDFAFPSQTLYVEQGSLPARASTEGVVPPPHFHDNG